MVSLKPAWLFFLCLFVLSLSAIQIFVLFLPDLYSPILFILKSVALQTGMVLFFLNLLGLLILWLKKWYLYFSLSCLVHIFLLFVVCADYKIIGLSAESEIKQQGIKGPFSILTFSALTRTRNGQDIHRFLEQNDLPDVLCLQEVLHEDRVFLSEFYSEYINHKEHALAIASKWPITEEYTSGSMQVVNVQIDGVDFLVVNVHMPRPYRSASIEKNWVELFETIAEPVNAILCGDFNITPFNSLYDQITGSMAYRDAHEVGQGFGLTFPHKQRRIAFFGPQLRIDYLFTRGVIPLRSETLGLSDLSDHKAVRLRFNLANQDRSQEGFDP